MLCDGKFAPISHVVGKGAGLFKVVDGGAEDSFIADGFCPDFLSSVSNLLV
jgi:hypothetical protein